METLTSSPIYFPPCQSLTLQRLGWEMILSWGISLPLTFRGGLNGTIGEFVTMVVLVEPSVGYTKQGRPVTISFQGQASPATQA